MRVGRADPDTLPELDEPTDIAERAGANRVCRRETRVLAVRALLKGLLELFGGCLIPAVEMIDS